MRPARLKFQFIIPRAPHLDVTPCSRFRTRVAATVNQSVRFIATHGFWRSVALEAVWVLASITSTVFETVLVFKFGNNSVTAAAIRALISRRTARVSTERNPRSLSQDLPAHRARRLCKRETQNMDLVKPGFGEQ